MMDIHRYYKRILLITLVCMILPSVGVCLAFNDDSRLKADDKDYVSAGQYAPSWVINPVLNTKNQSNMNENAQKLNDIEKKASATPKKENVPDVQSQLPLQKKRSSGGGTARPAAQANTQAQVQVAGNVVPKIDDRYFIDPATADKRMQDAEAREPISIPADAEGNKLNIFQADGHVYWNITDLNGSIIGSEKNDLQIEGRDHSLSIFPDYDLAVGLGFRDTLTAALEGKTYISNIYVEQYAPSIFDIRISLTTYNYVTEGGSYKYEEGVQLLEDYYMFGDYKLTLPIEVYWNNYAYYDFKTEAYTYFKSWMGSYWENYSNKPSRYYNDSNTGPAATPTIPGAGVWHNDFTPQQTEKNNPMEFSSTESYNRAIYSRSQYSFDDLFNAYLSKPANSTNNIFAKYSDADNLKSNPFLDELKLRQRASDNAMTGQDYADGLADEAKSRLMIKYASLFKEINFLQDIITILQNNRSRTDIEDNLLQAAKSVMEESAYLDQDTVKEFQEAVVDVVRAVSELKGIMKEADFQAISKGLSKLLEEQHSIYNDYLKTTKDLYEKLQFLLGLLIEDESLPEAYTPLYSVSVLAKKKIAVDLALE
ncbi:MAG: hypothetical protein WC658_05395, partial [Candidatus Omnitrophota bacterium]